MSTSPGLDVIAPLNDAEVRRIRGDFPILGAQVHGRPLVYLDSGATSQRPVAVLDAERDFATSMNSAVHRGAHTLAAEATELFEDARTAMYSKIEAWLVAQGVPDAASRVDAIARVTLGQAMGFLAQSTLDPGFDQDAYVTEATLLLDGLARG